MEVWCHLVASGVVVLAHGTMVRRSSKQHTDTKSAADHITGGGESGRRWRVVWWRWKWREPLQRASVCVWEREREMGGWETRKFLFTAGWRVKNGHLECTGGHGAWEVWMNNTTDNVIPTIWDRSTFFWWLFGQRMWQNMTKLRTARQKCWEIVWRRKKFEPRRFAEILNHVQNTISCLFSQFPSNQAEKNRYLILENRMRTPIPSLFTHFHPSRQTEQKIRRPKQWTAQITNPKIPKFVSFHFFVFTQIPSNQKAQKL
jgi:hypothetical protein